MIVQLGIGGKQIAVKGWIIFSSLEIELTPDLNGKPGCQLGSIVNVMEVSLDLLTGFRIGNGGLVGRDAQC